MSRFTPAQIDDIKARNPVHVVAAQWVALRQKGRCGKYVGPCPLCSVGASVTASRFECDADKWVCAVCPDGGDVIRLVAKRAGLDPVREFAAVIELLGGSREIVETPDTARRCGAGDFRSGKPRTPVPDAYRDSAALAVAWLDGFDTEKKKADATALYRERERGRLYQNFWERAGKASRAQALAYLARRGLMVPDNARLRWLAAVPYFLDGKEHAEPIGTWPAMLAPILNADPAASAQDLARGGGYRFSGLHFTYLDPATPTGKAVIRHPDTGALLPSKKARGSKQGGTIDLGGCRPDHAETVVAGEGIENTLTGFTLLARAGRDIARTHFRAGIDLGNLAGKALDRLPHPTEKDAKGRPNRVPGVVPDCASAAMPLPSAARAAVWMCDGDSDPFFTRCAMRRVETRHARADLRQVFMWPGDGCDWNDKVMS